MISSVVQQVLKTHRNPRYDHIKALAARYCYRIRKKVIKFASSGEREADLLVADPAVVVAIVSLDDDDPTRSEAVSLVREGAPLKAVRRALNLPSWLRRLPPEAFVMPFEHDLSPCWFNESFGTRLLNEMPQDVDRTGRWFQAVRQSEELGGPEFARWIGSQKVFASRRPPQIQLLPLAMFCWYSTQSGLPGGQIVHSPWNEKMSLGRAAALTREWTIRSLQDFCLDPEMFKDVWCRSRLVDHVEVVPLITASSLIDDAKIFRNCLHRYVASVTQGCSHIYSLRRDGVRIAAMELRMSETTGLPRITQLCGPVNSRPPQEAVDAATGWLMVQLREGGPQPKLRPPRHSELLFQRDIWGPYERARVNEIGHRFKQRPPKASELLKDMALLAMLDRLT